MKNILVLNGPNLNMLGVREPHIYGHDTLDDIHALCQKLCEKHAMRLDFRQSNFEGELVNWIQGAIQGVDGVIINAAAYTHTSIAIHDALKLLCVPVIEVHLSNPKERETFRHHSYIEPVAAAVFAGHGAKGYELALDKMAKLLYSDT